MEQKYFGNYRGIVVQNNDPENNGRVKVWVPHINATMYNEWNQLASDNVRTDILSAKHVFLGQNVLSNVSTILHRLKEKLPWSEICQPIIGSGSSGLFQATRSIKSQIDDSSQLIDQDPSNPDAAKEYPAGGIAKVSFGAEELTGIHTRCLTNEALAAQLSSNIKKSTAEVESTSEAKAANFAKDSGGSSDISQASAPTIDSTPIEPVKTVQKGENIQPQGPLGDQITSDACGASPQHAFNKAPVRDEFHQQGTSEANNNIANPYTHLFRPPDYHNTARGSFSIPDVGATVWVFFEGGDPQYPVVWGTIFGAEDYKSIWKAEKGNQDKDKIEGSVTDGYGREDNQGDSPDYPNNYQNREVNDTDGEDPIEDNTYRGKWAIVERGGSIEIVSTFERELVRLAYFDGSYMEFNKLCTSRLATQNDQLLVLKDQFETVQGFKSEHIGKDRDVIIYGDSYTKVGDVRRWKPHSDKIKQLLREVHDIKRLFDVERAPQQGIDNAPGQTQGGDFDDCPICAQGIEYMQLTTKNPDSLTSSATSMLTCGIGDIWKNTAASLLKGTFELEPIAGGSGTMYKEPCWCCGGTGKSPSSQDGNWNPSQDKQKLSEKIAQVSKELLEHERELGRPEHREGGSSIDVISKNKTTIVGLTFNDFEPYRKDPVGKLVPYGIKVEQGGVYPQYKSSPLVEAVHVDDLPGGDYDLIVSSRFTTHVGGGGIRVKTTGNIQISGQIYQLFAESINIGARSDVCFDAGERFDVEADVITFRPRIVDGKTQQVAIFGSLNVAQNVIVRGGAHIEGELSVQHITAPREWHLTEVEPKITKASILPGKLIGVTTSGDEVFSVCAIDSVEVNPHVHWKADPAWTLMESYEQVRTTASRLNGAGVVAAHPVKSSSQYAEEVYPSEVRGRLLQGNHWNPDQPPNGDQDAMLPDPDINGLGDATAESTTDKSKERQQQYDQKAVELIEAAKKFQGTNNSDEFDRLAYDQAIVEGHA